MLKLLIVQDSFLNLVDWNFGFSCSNGSIFDSYPWKLGEIAWVLDFGELNIVGR